MDQIGLQLGTDQQVFMLFFAIFWGTVANVQPRWKAFQWPLFCKIPEAKHRALLSFGILNVLPLLFFGYVLWALSGRGPKSYDGNLYVIAKILVQGVLPAFGIFGIYRFWLAIIELRPGYFYRHYQYELPEKYRHVEPTYRHRVSKYNTNLPTVDLGKDSGWANLRVALVYIMLAGIFPWSFSLFDCLL